MKNKSTRWTGLGLLLGAHGLACVVWASTNSSLTLVGNTNQTTSPSPRVELSPTDCNVRMEVTNSAGNLFIRTNRALVVPVVFRNLSTNCGCIFSFDDNPACNDLRLGYSCKILTADGSDVSPIHKMKPFGPGHDWVLNPMESIALTYNMSDVWTKAKPGEYTVTIEKQLTAVGGLGACCKDHRVTSNPFRVRVLNDIE